MLERALSLTDASGEKQQIEKELADEHTLVGGYDRALGLYEGLLARSQGRLERARCWRGISTIHFYRGDMAPSLDAIWQSARLLGASVPARGNIGVIIGMVSALCALGIGKLRRFPRPKNLGERAKRLELASTYQRMSTLYYFVFPPGMMLVNLRAWLVAKPWGPSEQLAQAYAVLGFILGGVLGKHALAGRLAAAALKTVQQVESTWQEAFVRARIGALALFRGDYSEAISQLGQAKRSLQQYGDYAELGFAWVNLSQACYFQGRFKEGYALALEGYELFERIGSDMMARQFISMVAVMGTLIGIKSELEKEREGIARSELCRDYACQCIGMVMLGAVHAAVGEYDRALSALEQARKVRREHSVKFHYADMLDILELDIRLRLPTPPPRLTRALAQNRRIARARPAYAAWVALNEANHALLRGRRSVAMALYDRARTLATQQGARHLLANVHVDLARADPTNARANLQRALALHRECGAVHDEHRVEEALRALHLDGTTHAAHAVSPIELETR
jgi:tetratricopeptide (TPR) repeat protein